MADDPGGAPDRRETAAERVDRNFDDLLEELRVAQTGVQILVAFLLTLPFQQRFGRVTGAERHLYEATLVLAVLAASCLIAPVSQHRLLFRRHRKEALLESANRLAITGLVLLAASLLGATGLVFSVVAGPGLLAVAVGVLAAALAVAWFGWPIVLRRRPDPPGP